MATVGCTAVPIVAVLLMQLFIGFYRAHGMKSSSKAASQLYEHHYHHKTANFLVVAMLPLGWSLKDFVLSRVAKARGNKLGKSDFHGVHAVLIMPLSTFSNLILSDVFGPVERLAAVQATPVVGGPAKVGDMFNQYMDRMGQIFVETGEAQQLFEGLFDTKGNHVDGLYREMQGGSFSGGTGG